jgi:hypothetical protein
MLDYDEASLAASEQIAMLIVNFRDPKPVSALRVFLPTFHKDRLIDGHGLFVLDVHLCGDGTFIGQTREFAHGFIEDHGNDAAMSEATASRVIPAKNEGTTGAAGIEIELKSELHARSICRATTKAMVGGLGIEFDDVSHGALLNQSDVGPLRAT